MTPESELISVQAAAAALGVSERYVRRLASQGRVQGAKKIGRDWLIPSPPVVLRMAGKAR
jgi:excisionase family DNA binding protein